MSLTGFEKEVELSYNDGKKDGYLIFEDTGDMVVFVGTSGYVGSEWATSIEANVPKNDMIEFLEKTLEMLKSEENY